MKVGQRERQRRISLVPRHIPQLCAVPVAANELEIGRDGWQVVVLEPCPHAVRKLATYRRMRFHGTKPMATLTLRRRAHFLPLQDVMLRNALHQRCFANAVCWGRVVERGWVYVKGTEREEGGEERVERRERDEERRDDTGMSVRTALKLRRQCTVVATDPSSSDQLVCHMPQGMRGGGRDPGVWDRSRPGSRNDPTATIPRK